MTEVARQEAVPLQKTVSQVVTPSENLPIFRASKRPRQVVEDTSELHVDTCANDNLEQKPRAMELFCGSAGVTAEWRRRGCDSLAFDWVRNKTRPKTHIINMDLSTSMAGNIIGNELKKRRIQVLIMAPPCGTASRAREIPRHGCPGPLRSVEYPLGLQNLSGRDLERVLAANTLYELVARLATMCLTLGILFVIENPLRSLFWKVPCIADLLLMKGIQVARYDTCMHGGQRLKHQLLIGNFVEIEDMAIICDNAHSHLPYLRGIHGFDTASEAEYPTQFCTALVACCTKALSRMGWTVPEPSTLHSLFSARKAHCRDRIATWRQPRGRRSPQLLPEFSSVVKIGLDSSQRLQLSDKMHLSHDIVSNNIIIPAGSKLLGGKGAVESDLKTFGVYRTPEEWFDQTASLRHPASVSYHTDPMFLHSVSNILKLGRTGLLNHRTKTLEHYRSRAQELQQREDDLKKQMHPCVRKVMGPKRILLMKEMMLDAGLDPGPLVNHLVGGFGITGMLPETGLFRPDFAPPAITMQDLWRSSKWAQQQITSTVKSSGPEVDRIVTDETRAEVAKGWLEGPYTRDQLSELLGPCWVPNRRFCIKQGSKYRMIDDISENWVNATTGTTERLELGGVDEVLAYAKTIQAAMGGQISKLTDMNGDEVVFEDIHPEWRDLPYEVQGRNMDLKSAYKQLAVAPKDRHAAVIAIYSADSGSCELYVANALPFGATGAVMDFNWVARVLRDLLMYHMLFLVSNYFDDYPTLEDKTIGQRARADMEAFMDLLGWEVSESKALEFEPAFQVLGVRMDFGPIRGDNGFIEVSITEERKAELCEFVSKTLEKGTMSPVEAASYRGRFGFAYLACEGRPLAAQLRMLGDRAEQRGGSYEVDRCLAEALRDIKSFLLSYRPRSVKMQGDRRPVVIFTDGACEQTTTAGGVIADFDRNIYEAWGTEVPDALAEEWRNMGVLHAVNQAETWPVLVSMQTWASLLRGRDVIVFIDNEGVRESMVSGNSRSKPSLWMLGAVHRLMPALGSKFWFARVPSSSNPADAASRLRFKVFQSWKKQRSGRCSMCSCAPEPVLRRDGVRDSTACLPWADGFGLNGWNGLSASCQFEAKVL